MSADLDAELRAAFERAIEPVTPPADLADRVRLAARRKLAAGITTAVALAAAACVIAALVVVQRPVPRPAPRHGTARVIVRTVIGQEVLAIAARGQYLYAATDFGGDRPYALTAYLRATGRLIRRVSVPAEPVGVYTGPAGSVWLIFSPNQNQGPCGVWLLTANLDRRSVSSGCDFSLLPTGPTTALTQGAPGELGTLAMPPPGRTGRATFKPTVSTGKWAVSSLAEFGGHVAALLFNDFGNAHVVIAGQHGLSFGGPAGQVIQSMAAQGDSLWVTTTPPNTGPYIGPLIRLSARLRPITPAAIKDSPVYAQSEQVWSDANTIWVATASPAHPVVCFTDRGKSGRLGTVRVPQGLSSPQDALATAGHIVYVVGGAGVLAYPVPPQCR